MSEPVSPEEAARAVRKKSSLTGLLLGAACFVLGALVCLAYLLIVKPWKFPHP